MNRQPPAHVLRALHRLDPLLGARWNDRVGQWEITRWAEDTRAHETVLVWPHWELVVEPVLQKLRHGDSRRIFGRRRDWFRERFIAPGMQFREAKRRDCDRALAAGREMLQDAALRDMGVRTTIGAVTNTKIGNRKRKVT